MKGSAGSGTTILDKILAVTGETGSSKRRFLVSWEGYDSEEDKLLPRENIHPAMIKDFLIQNDLYDHKWSGARCPACDKPCKNEHGVKIHLHSCQWKPHCQKFTGTRADMKVKEAKAVEAQKLKPTVTCESFKLKNMFKFKYLGSIFCADDEHKHDVDKRVALAMSRCGDLRHIFGNKTLPFSLKMKIYKVAVSSLITYGSEAWRLTEQIDSSQNQRCQRQMRPTHNRQNRARGS